MSQPGWAPHDVSIGNRQLTVDAAGLHVTATSPRDPGRHNWSRWVTTLPDGLDHEQVVVHAGRALEWSTEIIVTVGGSAEVWWLSPWRVRRRERVLTTDGVWVRGIHDIDVTEIGYEFTDKTDRRFALELTDVAANCVAREKTAVDVQTTRFTELLFDAGYPYEVFISYKSEVGECAQSIARELRRRNARVWLDKGALGAGQYSKAIGKGIKDSQCYLIVVSENTSEPANGTALNQWTEVEAILNQLEMLDSHDHILVLYLADDRPSSAAIAKDIAGESWQIFTASEVGVDDLANHIVASLNSVLAAAR